METFVICKRYLFLLFICASSLQYTSGQGCPTDIPNTVVNYGDTPSFTRTAGDNAAVLWLFASGSCTYDCLTDVNPDFDNSVNPMYNTTFGLNSTTLKVLKATVALEGTIPAATSGIYLINYPDCTSAGGLVVIYDGPRCTVDDSNRDNVELSCSLNFSNYIYERLNPVMTFKLDGVQVSKDEPQPTSLDLDNPGKQNSISTYSIGTCDDSLSQYSCEITFSPPDSNTIPPYIDPNPPSFNYTCYFSGCAVM